MQQRQADPPDDVSVLPGARRLILNQHGNVVVLLAEEADGAKLGALSDVDGCLGSRRGY